LYSRQTPHFSRNSPLANFLSAYTLARRRRIDIVPSLISSHDLLEFLFWPAIILLGVRGLGWNYVQRLRARSWMTNHGRIELVYVEERHIRRIRYYVARLDYSYSVNGEYYSGFLERLFFWEKSADKFTETMRDQMVFIRANPGKPERSALLADDQPGGWPS
jgi:hypothetical protein